MKKKYKLILFDLDGVIIDSKKNMEISWSAVQVAFKIDIPFDKYFELIGRPFKDIMNMLGLSSLSNDIKKVYDVVSSCRIDLIKDYNEAIDLINKLRAKGIRVGVVTSKDEQRTLEIIRHLDILFDVIDCPDDSIRGKPNPDQLLRAILKCQIDPLETLYIGDMKTDYVSAKRAGMDYVHADWGFGDCNSDVLRASKPSDIMGLII